VSVLAADLGGTWLRTAVVLGGDDALHAVRRARLRTVFDGRPSDEVWDDVVAQLGSAARSDAARDAERVAVAFPGPLAGGAPLAAPTLTGAAPVPGDLVARIADACGRRVDLVNDVAAAAAFLAARTRDRDFFVVTVSSGIGSRVHRAGARRAQAAYDGEIGHLVVDERADAPACDCGGRGHLGALASGRAIERAARAAAAADPRAFATTACARAGATAATLTNEAHLVPAMLAGDAWSLALLRAAVAPLARVALQTVVAAGLERVYVIGGFAVALGAVYRDALAAAIAGLIDSPAIRCDVRELVRVVDPGTEAALRGAALAS
jgi:predicted NBD/HSP70 family sugar kinase